MGRTSKFTFPYPGRKHTASKTKEPTDTAARPNASKAQKLLGTGDLNIDSPARDDASSRSLRPTSRGMSIAVSESTHDGTESYMSQRSDDWDAESGVLPHNLRGKASSTLLGHRFHEETSVDNSSVKRRLRGENSSSTLRSHYDRQKSPLSVSQQTSASSIRDQALRKGFSPVTAFPRSPLLHVDFIDNEPSLVERQRVGQVSTAEQAAAKKKPAKLDLSRLFSKSRKDATHNQQHTSRSNSILSPASGKVRVSETDGRRRLVKVDSRGIISEAQKQEQKSRNVEELSSPRAVSRHANEELRDRPPHQPITLPLANLRHPEPQSQPQPTRRTEPQYPSTRNPEPLRSPLVTDEQFTWKGVHASIGSPPWDKRSFTSNSSRNTKESRRTGTSVFSSSDLRNHSVLSLSSEEGSDDDNVTSPQRREVQRSTATADHASDRVLESHSEALRNSRHHDESRSMERPSPPLKSSTLTNRQPGSRIQDENFLTIPLPSPAGSRISGPWNTRRRESTAESLTSQNSSSSSPQDTSSLSSRNSRRGSVASIASSTRSSARVMQVTKQEEALLEALRQKRARMKDEMKNQIIAENETQISSPRPRKDHGTRESKSSTATVKAMPHVQDQSRAKFRTRDVSKESQRTTSESHGKYRTRDASNNSQRTIIDTRERFSSQDTRRDSHSTPHGKNKEVGHILLYLDRPIHGTGIETAEPSPDLSDFLSFGSDDDENETPRTSWIIPNENGPLQRPDSFAAPNMAADSPVTPKSAARLSAVGPFRGFDSRDSTGSRVKGVSFVDERHAIALGSGGRNTPNGHDFLDDVEDDAVWGM